MNINDYCYVKLTPAGVEHFYRKQHELGIVGKMIQHPKQMPNSEYYSFQLWELMQTFGDMLYNGAIDMPFEKNEILFDI